ncbi:MAG: hypothetical protein GQ527_06485 [Bacteroidales bacterium]|nr:hypothetical protein [Bacteroidales bacterium]
MKKITFLLLALVIIITNSTFAQVAINADGDEPNSKSILDVKSTTKGMLVPRMLTSERTDLGNTLSSTEKGMLVYDTELGAFYYYDGSAWVKMAAYGSADDDWTISGDNMYSAVSGNVGIGRTSGFEGKLDVQGKLYVDNQSGIGMQIYTAGTPAGVNSSSYSNGVEINGAQGNGVYVGRVNRSGIEIDSAGQYGIRVNNSIGDAIYVAITGDNGLHIQQSIEDAIYIANAGSNGISIDNATSKGVYIGTAGTDGLYIYKAGNPTAIFTNTDKNGIEIAGAEGHGIYIGQADKDGVHVLDAGGDGVLVSAAGDRGVYANTTQSSQEWGIYTPDKIYGSNLTSKSSSTYGLNTGNQLLQPGDVVCIAGGMENNIEGTENLFAINLEMANDGNKQAVFGVVEYKVNVKTNVNDNKTSDNQIIRIEDKAFAYADGDINAGDYFSVIILGPAEVNVDSKASIKVGDNVCIGNNGVSSQRVTEINGISIAENVGILGKSMGTSSSNGKMLVYVNCK